LSIVLELGDRIKISVSIWLKFCHDMLILAQTSAWLLTVLSKSIIVKAQLCLNVNQSLLIKGQAHL